MCRARDPHFQPWISVPEHIIFTNFFLNIRSGASPFYIFFGGFCRSGDHHFQNFYNFDPFIASHGRLSPNAKRSAAPRVARRVLAVPESGIFTRLKTDQARSGPPHFQAQNCSSSFRSLAFSRSTGSSFRSPCPFFTFPRHIPIPTFGVSTPPPPGPHPLGAKNINHVNSFSNTLHYYHTIKVASAHTQTTSQKVPL